MTVSGITGTMRYNFSRGAEMRQAGGVQMIASECQHHKGGKAKPRSQFTRSLPVRTVLARRLAILAPALDTYKCLALQLPPAQAPQC